MANTIGFGQAAVNNTIDYGQGAIDNTINWGKSQTLSPSGETNITGTGATPSFSNVNSFSFDGVDDYFMVPDTSGLSFGNGSTDSPFSISAWVKMDDATKFRVVGKYGATNIEYLFGTSGTDTLIFNLYDNSTGGRRGRHYSTAITSFEGQWIHLAATYNGNSSTSGLKVYLNGSRVDDTNSTFGTYVAMENTLQPLEIGKLTTTNANGLIDETAIFTTELSQSDITAIYNNGEPQSLDAYSPFVWFRLGDNATWNGATWTMTSVGTDTRIARSINMVEANRTTDVPTASTFANTKSIALDGVDDFVDVNNSSSLQITGALSLSFWIYGETNAQHTGVITKTPNTSSLVSNTMYHIQFQNSNQLRFAVTGFDLKSGTETTGTIPSVSVGSWQHFVMTWNGTNTMTVYKDGTQVCTKVQSATISSNTDAVYLGRRNGFGHLLGKLDEVAIFSSELSQSDITAIYGGGSPSSLSSYSSLISWWRCGDGDTAPILTDNGSGGNDGTMTNFSTFSTDVPTASTFANTKSIALDGIDDFVDIGNPSNLSSITSISISAWFKTTDAVGGLVIVGSDSNTQGRRYVLRTHNSSGIKLRFFSFYANGPYNDIIGTTNINDGQWHHVLAINNGTNLKIYVDGVLDNSNTDGNLINTTFATPNINIGRRSYSGVEGYFDGSIDEVAIWSNDQSANASAIGGTIPTDLSAYNPLGWWRCGDGDTSPTLTDNGSGGNDGTMTNFTTFSTDVPT